MRTHRQPGPLAHAKMRIICQRAHSLQQTFQRLRRNLQGELVRQGVTNPPANRIRAMPGKSRQPLPPHGIKHDFACQHHAL